MLFGTPPKVADIPHGVKCEIQFEWGVSPTKILCPRFKAAVRRRLPLGRIRGASPFSSIRADQARRSPFASSGASSPRRPFGSAIHSAKSTHASTSLSLIGGLSFVDRGNEGEARQHIAGETWPVHLGDADLVHLRLDLCSVRGDIVDGNRTLVEGP